MASEALHHRYVIELLAAQDVARRLGDAIEIEEVETGVAGA
jgi:hypothetical protein